jgi:hypothetical protein
MSWEQYRMKQHCQIEQVCPRDWTSMRAHPSSDDHPCSVRSSVAARQTRSAIVLRRILRLSFHLPAR